MRLLCVLVFCLLFGISFSQEKRHTSYFDVNYFKGNIALHSKDVLHLITEKLLVIMNGKNDLTTQIMESLLLIRTSKMMF